MKKVIYVFASLFLLLQACNGSKKIAADKSDNMQTALTDTYWKLTELNGKPVGEASEGRREVYLVLRKKDNQAQGNAGCNGYGGTYELNANGFNIKFSRIMHTMMACPGLEVENEYLKVLETADSYYVKDGVLQLNRARMAPLAKFITVPEKAATIQ